MDNRGEILLAQLVKNDDNLEEIRDLLARGADPNYRVFRGRTPLHEAALSNLDNLEAATELIRYGANVNLSDDRGYTALHFAVMSGNFFVARILLQSGASANATNLIDETPLHLAVKELSCSPEVDLSVLEELLASENIDCNKIDFYGNTPLMVAVKEKVNEAVELLLYRKANPHIPDTNSQTALHIAFDEEMEFTALELLKYGANIYAVNREGKTPLDILLENMESDDSYCSARDCFKFIAFRYHVTEALKQKLQRFPDLLQSMEKWCAEVDCMKVDILIYDTTFHDFILNCFKDPKNPQYPSYLISLMYKRILERFMMGLYPEYFIVLFVCVPSHILREVLRERVEWRLKTTWRNPSEPELPPKAETFDLLSLYLGRLDLFYLILSLSDMKIPDFYAERKTTVN